MIYSLQNATVRVQVTSKGAELSSLQANGQEWIWQADPTVWARHAPVLFPIVGKLKDNQYRYGGHAYPLPQHGFARDLEFACVEQAPERLVFELRANDETRKVYPFSFRFRTLYTLKGNQLEIGHEVVNEGQEALYFSIGAHPGFTCPLLPGERFEDYYLEFEQNEIAERHLLSSGLFNGETELVLNNEKILPLNRQWFEKDAIVLKNLQSQSVSLRNKANSVNLRFDFPGFPYLGIWTKDAHSPFICIEPWFGLADHTTTSGKIEEKEGIQALAPSQAFTCAYRIAVSY